ncbi:MAG TPA: NlpC/P60 family protein [Acidimicrobiales bacterium]|nr:NlpC/P60 family protein [Acidimicrobiales bacterium]
MKLAAIGLVFVVTALVAATAGAGILEGVGTASPGAAPSPAALAEIPAGLLGVYQDAAATCPGLPWPVLAAVGWVESRHADGHVDPSTGAVAPPIIGPPLDGRDGRELIADPSSPDGFVHALGPMQFLDSTWFAWATLAPGRPPNAQPDPQNAWDAIYTAARDLCGGQPAVSDVASALYAYNHSSAYVTAVLAKAADYAAGTTTAAADPGPGRTFPGDGAAVVAFALTQLGVPYVWGGDTPGVALDCSGLVQIAYRTAGVALPRTTFEQASYGTTVAAADLRPGDLLFFRGGDPVQDLGHVTIYAGNGTMISAPHTGAVVQIEPVPYGSIELARRVLEGS